MIGEIEAALAVEHHVVGAAQRVAVARVVEPGDFARLRVDALDAAAGVSRGVERPGQEQAAQVDRRERPAVVADEQRAVGAFCETVGPAGNFGDHFRRAVGHDACDALAEHLDDEHRAVVACDWPSGNRRPLPMSCMSEE